MNHYTLNAKKRMNVETFLFSLLLIIAIFSGFGIRPFYIGAGLILMSFSAISLVVQKRDKEEIHSFWLLIVWIAYHLFCALSSFSVRGIYICFQHIGIIFIFWFVLEGDKFKLLREEIKGLNRIIHWGVLLVLGFLICRKSPNIAMYESYIYIGLVSIPFVIAEWKRMRRIRIICLCLIWFYVSYQVGARSQSVGFLLFILVAVLLLLFKGKGKRFLKKAFWGYYAFLNIFPMIYSYLAQSPYRATLEEISYNLTKARFFSGRDELWLSVYNQMDNGFSVIFGLGVNKTEAITTQMEMSLHNLYVTLLSEGGLILVVLMGLILYQIWKRLVSDTSYQSRILLSFMIVFLYKQTFDISLIENNMCVAFAVWTALALACADARDRVGQESMGNFFTGE